MRFAAAVALVFACPFFARAHDIGVEVKLKAGRVVIEAFFDDDSPAVDAKATVTDAGGKPVTEGKTDSEGTWSFAAPRAGKYKATVDAGDDHAADATFVIPAQAAAAPASTDAAADDVIAAAGLARPALAGPTKRAIAAASMGLIALFSLAVLLLARNKPDRAPPEASR